MTIQRTLLLTLIQIPFISSLPHHPREREHGILRSHGSKAVVRPQGLVAENLMVAPIVNTVVIPSTVLDTTISATLQPVPTESLSIAPGFGTQPLPDTTFTDTTSFTSTPSSSAISTSLPAFTKQTSLPIPSPLIPPFASLSTESSSTTETTSVVVSSFSQTPAFSPTSTVEESSATVPTSSPTSTVEESPTTVPTSSPTSTVEESPTTVPTSSPTSTAEESSVTVSTSSTLPILSSSILESSSTGVSTTGTSSTGFLTIETISHSFSTIEPISSIPPSKILTPSTPSSLSKPSSQTSVHPVYTPSFSAPVYNTSLSIPPIYSTESSSISVSTTSTETLTSVTSTTSISTSTISEATRSTISTTPISVSFTRTKTRKTSRRSSKTTEISLETTVTQSESSPSASLISPSQTISVTSTISVTPSHTRTKKSTSFPALQPSHAASIFPPAVSLSATHTLVPSSTISLTLATTLTISEIQTLTLTTTVPPQTTGVVKTSLNTHGQNTLPPFDTTVLPPPSQTVRPITKGPNKITFTKTMLPTASIADNIFVPVARGSYPKQITARGDHPVPPIGIQQKSPIQTNKFYANFFLGSRNQATWTHPYSLAWNMGGGVTGSWGLSVSYSPRSKIVFGPGSPPSYYINALGIQSLVLSARELGASTDLSLDQLEAFSCNVNLAAAAGGSPVITFPLVQGMGFVTAVYNGGTPFIQSGVFFDKLTYGGTVSQDTARYLATLTDGSSWFIYVTAENGSSLPTLTLANSGEIVGNNQFIGTVQVARVPDNKSSDGVRNIYDAAAGVFPIAGDIQASVSKSQGEYQLSWAKAGKTSKTLLMFALPHHVQSFSSSFKKSALKRNLQLDTTTKGTAIAVSADSWSLYHDDIPFDMGFAPWSPELRSQENLPASAIPLLQQVASYELGEDFRAQTYLDSMYFSGKGLAKFAFTVYAANNMAKDTGISSAGLVKLKQAFASFVNNQQIFPLVYDTVWGGVVSSCTYASGDAGCDFGNTYYNDHHFHYGYFVYTAAVIGYLDPSWLREGSNKAWVNTLVRDYANPVADATFPMQRMFDWYHGHSWAHGLYESGDGKDQESSSEDGFASYAIKMWGRTVGDPNMEARGNLMVAVQSRSFNNYYYMKSNNQVEPPSFVPNKASGIMFENKIDHTTYFGTNIEYIEGIHMIPLNPSSTLTRDRTFVAQEWATYFANGYVDTIQSGWRGILMANLAIIDPVTAYNFFAQTNFDMAWLDGGASRTWYLAWSAGLGGAPR